MRHPLYSALFLMLWGLARSPLGLATATWASVYLIVGSRIEEQRLIARYGDAYRTYRRATPAFLPWKRLASCRWKAIRCAMSSYRTCTYGECRSSPRLEIGRAKVG